MTGLVLFGRTRVSRSTVLGLGIAVGAVLVLQGRTFIAPIVPWDLTVLTSPILPVGVAVAAMPGFEPALHALEATVPRGRIRRVRLAWGAGVVGTLASLCALVGLVGNSLSLGVPTRPVVLAFGLVTFLSVGLIGALWLGADLGWLLPCLLATALVFLGRDVDQEPRSWAWVLHDPSSATAWVVPACLSGIGLAGYSYIDSVGLLRARFGAGGS